MPLFHLYTRRGCHLCEVMLEELLPLIRGRAAVESRDVDANPKWLAQYDIRVPVLEFDGEVIAEYKLDPERLQSVLKPSAGNEK